MQMSLFISVSADLLLSTTTEGFFIMPGMAGEQAVLLCRYDDVSGPLCCYSYLSVDVMGIFVQLFWYILLQYLLKERAQQLLFLFYLIL